MFSVTLTPRTRKTIAISCIVLVVFATFVPTVVSHVGAILLAPLWLVVPAVIVTVIRRTAFTCDDQPVSLLSLAPFRAPPVQPALG